MRRVARFYREAYGGLPRRVWLLCGVALVNRSGTMVIPFLALWLTEHRGLSAAVAGALIATFGVGGVIGSYLGGWLCDRIGAHGAQQASLLASGLAFLGLAGLRAPLAIGVGAFVLGVVGEAYRPAVMTAIADATPPERRARAFALLRLAVNVAMGIGPGLGGLLALVGYVWLFVVDAATAWAAAIVLWIVAARPSGAPPPALGGRPVRRAPAEEIRPAAAGSPWRDRPFLLLMLFVLVMTTAFFQVLSTLPLTLRDLYGLREHQIGGLLTFNALLVVLFEMPLVVWAERRETMALVGAGACLICFGLGMMPLGASLGFAMLTVAIWSAGEMLTLPLINVVVAARAAPAHRGRAMGIYTMMFSGAFVLAPVLGGTVYERLGPLVLWTGVGAVGPLLWLAALALRGPLGGAAART